MFNREDVFVRLLVAVKRAVCRPLRALTGGERGRVVRVTLVRAFPAFPRCLRRSVYGQCDDTDELRRSLLRAIQGVYLFFFFSFQMTHLFLTMTEGAVKCEALLREKAGGHF